MKEKGIYETKFGQQGAGRKKDIRWEYQILWGNRSGGALGSWRTPVGQKMETRGPT